jgi:oxygen-independent coproporphyrinogen III oxidase
MTDSLCDELLLRKDYLSSASLSTVYFGGGTPSILNKDDLEKIMYSIRSQYRIEDNAEITLEANPDDLSNEKLKIFKSLGVNRLSIGIQSFQNRILKMLNRAHSTEEALKAIDSARQAGFNNLSIDLIFSIPGQSRDDLEKDLDTAISLAPEHISVYGLTIEEKTVFGNWQKKGKFQAVGDEVSAEHFDLLISALESQGYEQYEISNFCRDGNYARHNTAYWQNKPYLGVGPGAHSYNGLSRQYNIANNHLYMQSVSQGTVPFTLDELQPDDLANEYLLTTLRTKWGCDIAFLKSQFGYDLFNVNEKRIKDLTQSGLIFHENGKLYLTRKGKFLADDVIGDLFWL